MREFGFDPSNRFGPFSADITSHVPVCDVRRGDSDVAGDIRFGCSENQVGFGWTNGAYLELLAGLR